MMLSTFCMNRPHGNWVDHLGGKDNDSLDCVVWATASENNEEERRSPLDTL
jgi:hypothetical protein